MNKLAIFDLDGTLFDTKDVNFRAYTHAIKKCGFSIDIDYKYYCDFCNGNNYKTFLPKIIVGIPEKDLERIHKEKLAVYSDFLSYAKRNMHLFALIDCIRRDYKTAVVTTASRQNTIDILTAFDCTSSFDFIITKEDVVNTKPDPECFFKAMEIANSNTDLTIIFEDSETGLSAAKLSGAHYFKVYGYN